MRRRFALTILAVTTMVTLSFSIPFAAVIKTVAADQALIAADHESQSLAGVLAATASPTELESFVSQLNADDVEQATVILPGGSRIGAAISIPTDDLALARAGRAFTTSWDGETHVLVPVRRANGQIAIGAVSVPGSLLDHGVLFAWAILALVSVFIVALGVVFADQLGRSVVASVRRLGVVTGRLQRGDLDARVEIAGPVEIREVGETLNTLASRIVEMLARERETAADLSHRLRTPLMALQLEADAITDGSDRQRVNDAIADLTGAVTSRGVGSHHGRRGASSVLVGPCRRARTALVRGSAGRTARCSDRSGLARRGDRRTLDQRVRAYS
jgi:signal transduction histidine kinase